MRYILLLLCVCSASALANLQSTSMSHSDYLKQVRVQAQAAGIGSKGQQALSQVKRFRSVSVNQAAEEVSSPESLDQYLALEVDFNKVTRARDYFNRREALFHRIQQAYSVPGRFLVARWALETDFGQGQGDFPALSVLVAKGAEEPQNEFWSKQILAALALIDQGKVPLERLRSNRHGQMGPLLMSPEQLLNYGVDFDEDGKLDVWNSEADAYATLANELKQQGWQADRTWGRQVTLTAPVEPQHFNLGLLQSMTEWQQAGVRRWDGRDLPKVDDLSAGLLVPDGVEGRIYLAYPNYRLLMRSDSSHYQTLSIGYLADRIKFQ
ncbi:lytic murein transglycosylase [Paraferrimonas sedimenticola]|uniref:Lytic transglycosylase n=1 Tax=Paraferrimonas sedimenticola TaxID=375674 RepID=A0AA37RWP3_9GAMM|nr:lytic murein transglycosylase [Paraferrimonas sedimenticola]GLP96503.1 lytic transglycosylase [Paraferrimonas sedimenticola]